MKIKSFEVSLSTGEVTKSKNINISKYEPPQEKVKGRKYKGKERAVYGAYLEDMFYKNEIDAYENDRSSMHIKSRTNKELQYDFLKDHGNTYELRERFKKHKESIGNLRTKYNTRRLYAQQNPVYIISLEYDDYGIVVVGGNKRYQYLYFEEAYRRCLDYKVADPRFVPPELLVELRNRKNSEDPEWSEWSVPSEDWIKRFQTVIRRVSGNPEMEVYNSVYFPPEWSREATPEDMDL